VPALSQDETMHADMFAQFLGPNVVAVGEIDPLASGPDAERLDITARALERVGRGELTVVRVPLPYLGLGEYRTYLNGLHLQRRFLVPSYRDVPAEVEAQAFAALSRAMPNLEIQPVPADDMIRLAGALHCVSLGLTLPAHDAAPRARAEARPHG
jgi:agmatine/peptidylarginine deiminase